MTLTDRRSAEPPTLAEPPEPDRTRGSSRGRGLAVVVGVAVAVALLAQLPLIRNHIFYYWDDSAAAFLPDWYQMGTQLRAGHWPVLDPSMWMGGNFAAEALMGVFNPVSLANFVVVSLLPDLALAATLVKTEFLVLFAVGVYLLAREYRANRAAAAVVATALPFAGYTLYFDTAAWVGGLMAYAWLPLVWCTLRRYARGVGNPIVPIVFGYLAMSTGNPYGALGVIVILLAVGAEQLVRHNWKRFGGIVAVGAVIGASTLVVFLPLLGSSAVSWRTPSGVQNDDFMVPNLGDLVGMSAPTYQPQFHTWGPAPSFPVFYVAWFILPLLPWLRFSALRERARERFGIAVFAIVFTALLVGPSFLWLFRFPVRLTEYVALPIGLAFALLLTGGFHTTWRRRRALVSVAVVLVGLYLSWASKPAAAPHHLAAAVLVLALLAGVLFAAFRLPRLVPVVLVSGTAVTLLMQVLLYPQNGNTTGWYFPHNVAAMKANYGQRYQGNTLQITDLTPMANAGIPIDPRGAWQDFALANTMHVAGVAALNSYTGVGDVPFSNALCMNYYGGTCAGLYQRLWRPAPGVGTTLADALRLETVVVLNGYTDPSRPLAGGPADTHATSYVDPLAPPPAVPAGWSVAQRTRVVTVLHRNTPVPWPDGRVSWAAPGVTVRSDTSEGYTGERTTYTGGGTLLFGALAWPGWTATVDGHPVAVTRSPAGLLKVDLPATTRTATLELSFAPPGTGVGIPLIAVGLLIGAGWGVAWGVRRRRRATA